MNKEIKYFLSRIKTVKNKACDERVTVKTIYNRAKKVELVALLNNGESKKACEYILNNEMDMQAWAMFFTGMSLMDYEDYRPLLPKIEKYKNEISSILGLREILRMNMLIVKLEDERKEE